MHHRIPSPCAIKLCTCTKINDRTWSDMKNDAAITIGSHGQTSGDSLVTVFSCLLQVAAELADLRETTPPLTWSPCGVGHSPTKFQGVATYHTWRVPDYKVCSTGIR